MPRPRYLKIKNLERYQHYKTRQAPWIKLYHTILDDPAFLSLDEISQGRYFKLLLLAHHTDNAILDDPVYLQKSLRLTSPPDLTPLKEAGFLLSARYYGASVPLAKCSLSPLSLTLSSLSPSEEGKECEKGEGSQPRKSNGRASVLSPEFAYDARAIALAESYGLNPLRELAAFRDHAAAKGRLCRDWQAAFRNWLRNTVKFKEIRR